MNKEHIKGNFEETKGKVKEQYGDATGDTEKQATGLGDQVKGKLREGFGDIKDKVTDLKDKAKEKMEEMNKSRKTG